MKRPLFSFVRTETRAENKDKMAFQLKYWHLEAAGRLKLIEALEVNQIQLK